MHHLHLKCFVVSVKIHFWLVKHGDFDLDFRYRVSASSTIKKWIIWLDHLKSRVYGPWQSWRLYVTNKYSMQSLWHFLCYRLSWTFYGGFYWSTCVVVVLFVSFWLCYLPWYILNYVYIVGYHGRYLSIWKP